MTLCEGNSLSCDTISTTVSMEYLQCITAYGAKINLKNSRSITLSLYTCEKRLIGPFSSDHVCSHMT